MVDARAQQIVTAYAARGVTMALAQKIVAVADALGAGAFDLANLINFESGLKATAINKNSGASGLIQFMPNTAKGLGTTVEAIRELNAVQQMDLVHHYFKRVGGSFTTIQGLYMAIFYPVARTWPLDKAMPANVQKANPGIKTVNDYILLVNKKAHLARGGFAPISTDLVASASSADLLEPVILPAIS